MLFVRTMYHMDYSNNTFLSPNLSNWISLYCNDDLIWVTGECITLSCSALYFANLSKVAYEPFYQHIIYLVLIYVFHNAFARCFSVQIPQYDTP